MQQLLTLMLSGSGGFGFWNFVGKGKGQETLEDIPGTYLDACDLAWVCMFGKTLRDGSPISL